MARQTHAQDLRAEVERSYGGELPDPTWDWLCERRYIEELEAGFYGVEDIVDEIRRLNAAAPAARRRARSDIDDLVASSEIFRGLNERMRAVAEFVARRAQRDLRVQRFRRRHLGGTLLTPTDVDGWINDRYWTELPSSWPSAKGPMDATNFVGALHELPSTRLELEWLPPDAETTKVWGVPRRTTLGELAELSEKLSSRWDWHPVHATAFVLTGDTPPRPAVRGVRFKPTTGWDDQFGSYRYMGVRCTIDSEVTPEQLAGWWRGVRLELGMSGKRPIRSRAVRLALFSLDRPESTSWRDDMRAWNEQASDDEAFDDPRNYRRAVLKAWTAINLSSPHRW